ncbi:MAG: hypothetical protein JXR37_08155 [Kiritimatiellae bacterium]|nr:hypothetical protein [Kiritimatiellia bacterium]
MIYKDVERHNTAEIASHPDGGMEMRRVPERVRVHLSQGGRGSRRTFCIHPTRACSRSAGISPAHWLR